MIRRFIIIVTCILFIGVIILTFIKLNTSLSPLKQMVFYSSNNTSISKSAEIKLKPPFISENETIYCVAEIRLSEHTQFALCRLLPEFNKADILFGFDSLDVIITGFAKEDNYKLFLFKNNKATYHCLRIKEDSIFKLTEVPELKNEKLTALSIIDGNPELITITDSLPSSFKKYSANSRKEFQWEQRNLRSNPFFMRISSPLGAYYKNNWFFLSTSEFYRRDSLYVNVPQGTTNVMLFRNNLSYHFDDIRVNEKPFSTENVDKTFSGILMSENECQNKYIYSHFSSEFRKITCPEDGLSSIPIYTIPEQHPERFPLYKKPEGESFSIITVIDGNNIPIVYSTDSKTGRTIFRFPDQEEKEFTKTSTSFNEIFFIPYRDEYLFVLDNGHFCKIDNELERTDNVNFNYKTAAFVKLFSSKLLQQPENFSSYSVPVILAGYPALIIAALFIFFIVRVFLTPKRPAYSSRKQKKTPLIAYLMPASFLYFLAFFIFIFNFISLLKII
jgi:hypothetical protein